MASLAGGSFDRPVGIVPCLSWTTASCVFTQGVMANAINWDLLQDQYSAHEKFKAELSNMIETPNAQTVCDILATKSHFHALPISNAEHWVILKRRAENKKKTRRKFLPFLFVLHQAFVMNFCFVFHVEVGLIKI